MIKASLHYSLLLVLYLFFYHANGTIKLGENDDYWFQTNDWEVVVDSSHTLTLDDVQSKVFVPLYFQEINNPAISYWLKTSYTCENAVTFSKYVFENYALHTSEVDFYIIQNGCIVSHESGGYGKPFSGDRKYATKNIVFDVPFQPGNSYTILMKVRSDRSVALEYKLTAQAYFTNYTIHEYWFLGLYYGALMLMCLFAFSLYAGSSNKLYLYYAFFIVSSILISLAEDGSGFEFLWPNTPQINNLVDFYLGPLLQLITLSLYVIHFVKIRASTDEKVIWIVNSLFILTYLVDTALFQSNIMELVRLIPFTLLLVVVMRQYRHSRGIPIYFLAGILSLYLSLIVYVARIFGIVPANIFTVYFFNFSMIIESIFFMLAIIVKIRMLKEEKNTAQEQLIEQLAINEVNLKQVNEGLEIKVKQRTEDLENKNTALELAQHELNNLVDNLHKINSKLDYDNWKLGKAVTSEKQKRIVGEKLSFSQYQELYPSEKECIVLLETLKWGNGFECRKCGNSKFTYQGTTKSRKCSRCNTIESPTVNTLFHGIKFPLEKAFYISYTCYSHMNSPIDELATTLEINKNTVGKFKKKCEDRLAEVKQIRSWEELIYGSQ